MASPTIPRWFPSARSAPDSEVQLFCLPHAGAGASAYRDWGARLAPAIEVIPVQLAGRETRYSEPSVASALEIVEQLTEPLLELADKPFAFFGHSMGALLSFELSHALARHDRPPLHLFVSGYDAPHRASPSGEIQVHTMPDDEMVAHVTGLHGTSLEVLEFPEMLQLLLPVLRADFAVCETYRYLPRPPLSVPITVLTGRDDPTVNTERMTAWSELSSGPVIVRDFPGDHFYLSTELDGLLTIIVGALLGSRR